MTTMDETQTIDADALRARLAEMAQRARDEMGPAGLRERIEAALRARDPHVVVGSRLPTHNYSTVCAAWAVVRGVPVYGHGGTEHDALAALAVAVGLNADGTDPRAEVARLRALLEVAQTSLAAATSGRRVTACDEIDRLQRERDTAQAVAANIERERHALREAYDRDVARLRGEGERLTLALNRAHYALREHGPRCSHPRCDYLAPYRCDDCGARFCEEHDDGHEGHDEVAASLPHAVGPDDLRAGTAMREAEPR